MYKLSVSEVLTILIFCAEAARATAERKSFAEWVPRGTFSAASPGSSANSFKTCCINSKCFPRRPDLNVDSGTLSTLGASLDLARAILFSDSLRLVTNRV